MQAARHRSRAGVQQHRSRPRSTTTHAPPPTSPRWPSVPRRRGLRVGYEALAWGRHVNRWGHAWQHRAAGRAPGAGADRGQLPHARDRRRSRRGSPHVPGEKIFFVQLADAPRAGDGRALLEPALPQFPGPGRSRRRRLPACGPRLRLSRAALARSVQRRVPRRTRADDGARRTALADRWSRRRPAATALPPPPRRRRRSSSSNSPSTPRRRASSPASSRALGFRHAGTHRSKAVRSVPAGRRQPRAEQRAGQRRLRALPAARRSVCAMALRVDDAARGTGARRGAALPGMARARSARASGASRRCARPTARSSISSRRTPRAARSGRTISRSKRTGMPAIR